MSVFRFGLLVLIASISGLPCYGHAASWFSGIGNDGYMKDATGLYEVLGRVPGWEDIRSNYYLGQDLSGLDIKTSVDRLMPGLMPGDRLLWFYSGHGSFAEDRDKDESGPGSTALDNYDETIGLLNDPDPLTDDGLASTFQGIAAKGVSIISIFDACYAGGFIGGTLDLNMIPGLVFMGSGSEIEDSYSFNAEPFSIFTQGLMDGLEDFMATDDPSGILTTGVWFDAAEKSTLARNLAQHPVFFGDPDLSVGSLHAVPIPGSDALLLFPVVVAAAIRIKQGRSKVLFKASTY